MNEKQKTERLKTEYPKGTRIKLDHMDDTQAPPDGTKGTVMFVDGIGQLHMKWDNGSSLALVPGVDSFSRIPEKEILMEDQSKEPEKSPAD